MNWHNFGLCNISTQSQQGT